MATTSAKVVGRIPLLGAAAGATADCVVQEAGLRELRNWHRFIHDPYIAGDPARLDRSWKWPRYLMASYVLNESHGRLTEAFQIVVASRPGIGACLYLEVELAALSRRRYKCYAERYS